MPTLPRDVSPRRNGEHLFVGLCTGIYLTLMICVIAAVRVAAF